MKDKIIKSKAVITADMISKTDTTIDKLLSKDVCEAQIEEMAKYIRPVLKNRVDIGFIPDLDKPIAKTLVKQGYRKVNKDECEYWKSRCKEIGDVAYEKARKETAEKILNEQYQECKVAERDVLIARGGNKNDDYYKGFSLGMANTKMHIQELAKHFGVEIKG